MSSNSQTPSGTRTHFKTPEGRYKLSHEKYLAHTSSYYVQPRGPTKVTIAHLKEKPVSTLPSNSNLNSNSVSASTSTSLTSRFIPSRFLSSSSGRSFSFSTNSTLAKITGFGSASSTVTPNNVSKTAVNTNKEATVTKTMLNSDAQGTHIIFNVYDCLFIADFNTADKDPIKVIQFSGMNSLCHSFDNTSTDGHDLIIGTNTGLVFSCSLQQQLQEVGRKIINFSTYNKDSSFTSARCTKVLWVPNSYGNFVSAHADGNILLYDQNRDNSIETNVSIMKDLNLNVIWKNKSIKSNPVARWRISKSSVNDMSFSDDGKLFATAGRDGYLRIFDWKKEVLICGGKSYYGAFLCCSFSHDGKYVIAGGEDDLIHLWSVKTCSLIAWFSGHSSWVSGVAFDPFWNPLINEEEIEKEGEEEEFSKTYRFASIGQDAQLLLWDVPMDEIVQANQLSNLPNSSLPATSTSDSSTNFPYPSHSSEETVFFAQPEKINGVSANVNNRFGILQPSPSRKSIPTFTPIMANKIHSEPISSLVFTKETLITSCHEARVKVWVRPKYAQTDSGAHTDTDPTSPTKSEDSYTPRTYSNHSFYHS